MINYLRLLFFILATSFIFFQIFENFVEVKKIVSLEAKNYIFVLAISILSLNVANYRFYYFLKKVTKYSNNYGSWSKLFFQTVVMNLFLIGSGHFFRAAELKKNNVDYIKFIRINYIIYQLILAINLLIFLILYYFLTNKKIIFLFVLIFLIFLYFCTENKFYYLLFNIVNKNILFLKRYKKLFIAFLLNCKIFLLVKKNLIIIAILTLAIFILDVVNIYLIAKSIINNENLNKIAILFIFIVILNKFSLLNNFVGLNEIISGYFAINLDLLFIEGVTIQLIFRISIYIGALICVIISNFNSNKKSKFFI